MICDHANGSSKPCSSNVSEHKSLVHSIYMGYNRYVHNIQAYRRNGHLCTSGAQYVTAIQAVPNMGTACMHTRYTCAPQTEALSHHQSVHSMMH